MATQTPSLLQTLDGVALTGAGIAAVHADLGDSRLDPHSAVAVSTSRGPIYRVRVDVLRAFYGIKPRAPGAPGPERWHPNGAIDPTTGKQHGHRSPKGIE